MSRKSTNAGADKLPTSPYGIDFGSFNSNSSSDRIDSETGHWMLDTGYSEPNEASGWNSVLSAESHDSGIVVSDLPEGIEDVEVSNASEAHHHTHWKLLHPLILRGGR